MLVIFLKIPVTRSNTISMTNLNWKVFVNKIAISYFAVLYNGKFNMEVKIISFIYEDHMSN